MEDKELMETTENEEIEFYDSEPEESEEDGSAALGTAILVGFGTLLGIGASWVYRKVKPKVKEGIKKVKPKKSKKSEAIDVDVEDEDKK